MTAPLSDHLSTTLPKGLKRSVRRGAQAVGRATGSLRVLPDYLLIGEARCGTTSYFKYLVRHPNVGPVITKEVQYFSDHFDRGPAWYRGHFPTRAYATIVRRRTGAPMIAGEASPFYLFHPLAGERILETLPDVKLLVILRDPVKRAYSLYRQQVDLGNETLSFSEAIAREPERLRGEIERMRSDPHYFSGEVKFHSYVARGDYATSLERWFGYFPRERFLIVRAEDLFDDPAGVMAETHRFLGLPPFADQGYPRLNEGSASSHAMDPDDARGLRERYAEPNARLATLLGRDLGWMS
jgi:Sulfotransferase domain